jgi:hypothetical protein
VPVAIGLLLAQADNGLPSRTEIGSSVLHKPTTCRLTSQWQD